MAEAEMRQAIDDLSAQVASLTTKVKSMQGLTEQIADLRKANQQIKASLDGFRITGPWFSGQGAVGIRFDPPANLQTTGMSALISVCVSDGAGGGTAATATFTSGSLVSIG